MIHVDHKRSNIYHYGEKRLSEAKLKVRSEASRQKYFFLLFSREASLRALSFVSLSNFKLNSNKNNLVIFAARA